MSDGNSDLSKVVASASLVLVGTLLNKFSGLAERVILGRFYSPEAYGEFNLALAVMSIIIPISLAGYHQGVTRYVARSESKSEIRGTILTGVVVTFPFSIIICLILILTRDTIVASIFEGVNAETLFLLFILAIPAGVGFRVGLSAIRGLENTKYTLYAKNLVYPSLRLSILVVLTVSGFGIFAAGYSYLFASVGTLLVTFWLLSKMIPIMGPVNLQIKEMSMFSVPLFASTVIGTLLTKTDTLLLGYFRSSYEVGMYGAAFPLATTLTIFLSIFGYMYLPVASRLDSKNEQAKMERVYRMTTKWVYVLTFPVFLVFVVSPTEVVTLVFGDQYSDAGVVLPILATGFFTEVAVGRSRDTLAALGQTNHILYINLVAIVINILANIILIPKYGVVGAATASVASYALMSVLVYLILELKFGISPFNQTSARLAILLPTLLLPTGFLFANKLPDGALGIFFLGFVAGFATLLVVVISGSLEPDDIVIVEFIEGKLDIQIPYVRQIISRLD